MIHIEIIFYLEVTFPVEDQNKYAYRSVATKNYIIRKRLLQTSQDENLLKEGTIQTHKLSLPIRKKRISMSKSEKFD